MRVVIQGPERYVWGKSFNIFNTTVSEDMTARVPAAGTHRYVLISIDAPTNALQYTDGTAVAIALPAVAPDVPSDAIPVALVHLTNGDTTITDNMIYDYRTYINAVSSSGESPWANVWIVATSGGDFTEPGDANDSADVAAGDVIWVMPGTYDGFTVTKNLTFVGLGDTANDGIATGRVVISGLSTAMDIQAESSFQHIIFEDDDVTINTTDTVSFEHCRNADYNLTCGAYAVNVILKDSYWYDIAFGSATGGQLYIWHCDGGFGIDHGAAALYITASDYSAPITGSGARYTTPNEHAEKTAATSTPVTVMEWTLDSTGAPAAGFAQRHEFKLESGAGEAQDACAMDVVFRDPTSGAEDSAYVFFTRTAGDVLQERFEIGEVLGKMFFSKSNGLLLLDMQRVIKEDSTNYVIGSRKEKATLTGALHVEQGRWMGKQGIVVEEGTTNYVKNPSFEVNVADYWSLGSSDGSATRAQDSTRAVFGGYSCKLNKGTATWAFIASDSQGTTLTLDDGDTATASAYVWVGSGTALLRIYAASTNKASVTSTKVGQWERLEASYTNSSGASENLHVRILFNNAVGDMWTDAIQFEIKDYATTYCDGSLGDGYSWSGTAHASTSTRTVTVVNLDDYVGLLNGNNTLSFRFVVQAPYDYDATWPGGNYGQVLLDCRDSANAGTTYLLVRYQQIDNTFRVVLGSNNTTASYAPTFSAGDWLDIVVTLDYTNNEQKLYLDGVLVDTANDVESAQTTLGRFRLCGDIAGIGQAGWNLGEFAVFDTILTAAEVAQLYNFHRALVDMGAFEYHPTVPPPSWGEIHIFSDASGDTNDTTTWREIQYDVAPDPGMFRFSFASAHVSGLIQFEVFGYAAVGDGRVRLYNVTDSMEVPESELTWTNGTAGRKRTAALSLPKGECEYRVEFKTDTTGAGEQMNIYMARLMISPGLSTL